MDPTEWMTRFRLTHEKAKGKKLNDSEYKEYLGMREELARSLVAAQSLQVPAGENHRKYFRVAQMFPLEIDNTYKSMTRMLSRSGFAAQFTAQMAVGKKVAFSLVMARDTDPITGEATVVSAVKQGAWLISFNITQISEPTGERLETALFDAVLQRFK